MVRAVMYNREAGVQYCAVTFTGDARMVGLCRGNFLALQSGLN